MSWSFRLGRIAGIPIFVHWTFLILLAWLVYGHWVAGHDLATTLEGVGFVLAIFGCVVLHELGHVAADDQLGPALVRLRDDGEGCLEVVENGRPIGLLTAENIGELLMVRAALAESGGASPPAPGRIQTVPV